VDVVACVRLDRLARSTHHLLSLGRELEALGVDLVATEQAVDTTTPAGRLLFAVLGAIAEFERDLIRERVVAGMRRARVKGTRTGRAIGRPRLYRVDPQTVRVLMAGEGLSLRAAARRLGVSAQAAHRAVRNPLCGPSRNPLES
jgi:DNA invertase Pin-like site-specific DNA recombinase